MRRLTLDSYPNTRRFRAIENRVSRVESALDDMYKALQFYFNDKQWSAEHPEEVEKP